MQNQPWRIVKLERMTFFSALQECDIHYRGAIYRDKTTLGKVTSEGGEALAHGPQARRFFFDMQANEEMQYAMLRARIKALTGFPDWKQDKPSSGSVTE